MLSQELEIKNRVKQLIQNTTHSEVSYFNNDNGIYLIFCLIDLVLYGFMMLTFKENPVMFIVSASIFGILLLFLADALWIYNRFKTIHSFDDTTEKVIKKHINFYQKDYALWLMIKPLIVIAGAFAVSALSDQINGHYVINNPLLFALIYLMIYFIIYFLNRYFSQYYSDAYISHLQVLENEIDEESIKTNNPNKIKIILLILLISLFLLLGLSIRFLLT